ncbi:MAG: hypothetical protein D6689_03550 [Deltaproteobacteria bacterium]|nr:MAG: hypothetical protein D6689_03550 [Deltaproteobacteria bacterium]
MTSSRSAWSPRRLAPLVWTAAFAAAALACGGGDDDDDTTRIDAAPRPDARAPDAAPAPDAGTAVIPEELPDPLPNGPVDVTAVTYNVAFTQLIKYAPERMPLVVEAIRGLDADLVCMQEVFLQYTSPAQIAAMVEDVFPYSYWSWTGVTPFNNGILMLSKHPLYRGRELFFDGDGQGVDRIALAVDVVTDTSYFHWLCTHFEAFDINITKGEAEKVEA